MEYSKDVSLLELTGLYNVEYDKVCFFANNKIITCKYENIYKLIDPVYDQTFKSIFTFGHESNNISGKQRIISFLNSLLSSKYGEKITDVEYLPNEFVEPNEKGRIGMRIVGIVLKANFESGRILYIDLEIQTTFYQKISKRWVEYASRLFSNARKDTLVLVLQIGDEENYFYSILPIKKENNTSTFGKKVDETFEIISIDVNKAISLIRANYPIEFENIQVSEEGKNWLKLIGLRFWIRPYNKYYILPNELNASSEILSAIYLLSKFTPENVEEIIRNENKMKLAFEDGFYYCEEKIQEDYTIKLWMNLFKNGITNLPPTEIEKVKEKKVRQLFKNDPYLVNFISFLSQNGKLI